MPRCRILLVLSLIGALTGCARTRHDGEGERSTPTVAHAISGGNRSSIPKVQDRREPSLPKGFVRVDVGGVVAAAGGHAVVLLVDDKTQRAVPIFIGEAEALAIQLRLEKRAIERPLTHDLLDSMIKKLGGSIESVRVERLHDGIFFGIVVLRNNERRIEIDARSSDAVALAVGNHVPIFMSEAVMERAGVSLKDPEDLELLPSQPDQRASPVTL